MNPQRGHLSAEAAQAFLDGRASEEDVRTLEAHVRSCGECHTAFDQWKAVYARLGHLENWEPSVGFAASVMERLRYELDAVATATFDADGHFTTDLMLDHVDGQLSGADAQAARVHLAACSDCSQQEVEWRAVFGSIGALSHHEPSPGFSESVLVAARIRVPIAVAVPARIRALDAARTWVHAAVARVRNRDRKSFAVLAGLGTAPAAVVATLGWVVLTHPLVTTSGLLRFALLKAGQFTDGMVSVVLGGASDSAVLTTAYSGFELVTSAPVMAALGGFGLLLLMSLSTWVLFRNLAPIRGLTPATVGQSFSRTNQLGAHG